MDRGVRRCGRAAGRRPAPRQSQRGGTTHRPLVGGTPDPRRGLLLDRRPRCGHHRLARAVLAAPPRGSLARPARATRPGCLSPGGQPRLRRCTPPQVVHRAGRCGPHCHREAQRPSRRRTYRRVGRTLPARSHTVVTGRLGRKRGGHRRQHGQVRPADHRPGIRSPPTSHSPLAEPTPAPPLTSFCWPRSVRARR